MARAGAHNEVRVGQLTLQPFGHRQRCSGVVVTPDELDGTLHSSERRGVILGERAHENVPHDTGGRTVVIGPVALSQHFNPVLADHPVRRESARHSETQPRLGAGTSRSMKRCSAQHKPSNPIWTTRGEMHRDATSEGMPEHDDACLHLLEHGGDCSRIVRSPPDGVGRRGTSEAGQVERDRIHARGRENSVEVPVVSPPSVQSQGPRRARAIRLPEQV